MAERIKRHSFVGVSADGSLAYDYSNPKHYPDFSPEQFDAPAPPKVRVRETPRTKTRIRGKQSAAPFAIAGYACAAVMVVFLLMGYIQLAALSNETVELQEQLDMLHLEETRLLISYESAFNLTEIEQYAINELGMQKPRSDQIFYVDGSAPDKAVIYSTEIEKDGFFDRIVDMIASFGEFFSG